MSLEKINQYFSENNIEAAKSELRNLPKDTKSLNLYKIKTPEALKALEGVFPQGLKELYISEIKTPDAATALKGVFPKGLQILLLRGTDTPETVAALKGIIPWASTIYLPDIATPATASALEGVIPNDGVNITLCLNGIKTPNAAAALKKALPKRLYGLQLFGFETPELIAGLKDALPDGLQYLYIDGVYTAEAVKAFKGVFPDEFSTLYIASIKTPDAVAALKGIFPKGFRNLYLNHIETPDAAAALKGALPDWLGTLGLGSIKTPDTFAALKGVFPEKLWQLVFSDVTTPEAFTALCNILADTNITRVTGVTDPTGKLQEILKANQNRIRLGTSAITIKTETKQTEQKQDQPPQISQNLITTANFGTLETVQPEVATQIAAQINADSLKFLLLLRQHEAPLKQVLENQQSAQNESNIFAKLMSQDGAKNYYCSIISSLSGSYIAAAAVKSKLIAHNKSSIAGDVGKIIQAVGEIVPIVGGGVKAFGVIIKTVDYVQQKQKLDYLANLSHSVVEMDNLAKNVALELLKQGRHYQKQNLENDVEKMLIAIFDGKIDLKTNPDINVAAALIQAVTGKTADMSQYNQEPAKPLINIVTTPVFAPSVVDHSEAIASLNAKLIELTESSQKTQKELANQREKTRELELKLRQNTDTGNDIIAGGGFTQKFAQRRNQKSNQRSNASEDYNLGETYQAELDKHTSVVATIVSTHEEKHKQIDARLEILEHRKKGKVKNSNDCCILM